MGAASAESSPLNSPRAPTQASSRVAKGASFPSPVRSLSVSPGLHTRRQSRSPKRSPKQSSAATSPTRVIELQLLPTSGTQPTLGGLAYCDAATSRDAAASPTGWPRSLFGRGITSAMERQGLRGAREPAGASYSDRERTSTDAKTAVLYPNGTRPVVCATALLLLAATAGALLSATSVAADRTKLRPSRLDDARFVAARSAPTRLGRSPPLSQLDLTDDRPVRRMAQPRADGTTQHAQLRIVSRMGSRWRVLRPLWAGANSSWSEMARQPEVAVSWPEMVWPEVVLIMALVLPTSAALSALPAVFLSLAKHTPSRRLAALCSHALGRAAARGVRMAFRLRWWRNALQQGASARAVRMGLRLGSWRTAVAKAAFERGSSARALASRVLAPAPRVARPAAQTAARTRVAMHASRPPLAAQNAAAARVTTAGLPIQDRVPHVVAMAQVTNGPASTLASAPAPLASAVKSAEVAAARTVQTPTGVLKFY